MLETHPPIALGLENCLNWPPDVLAGRYGLLANQASVDSRFRFAGELLAARFPDRLTAIFSPQHGLWSEDQDNMIETPHGFHPRLRVPVYSLYAASRRPTPEQLCGLDCLVVDLQDVGTRVYTYIWTLTYCLEACAECNIPLLVLDRPNPLGGRRAEGPRLDPAYASFVGRGPIPMAHGLTIGEIARYLNAAMDIGATLQVVPMTGWKRDMTWLDIDRPWIPPSPNLPRLDGVQLYSGMVLLEGTNLSEGRGTTTPFEVVGAPFVDPHALLDALEAWHIPGVTFRPLTFKPTFQKWQNKNCGGLFLHVTDFHSLRAYRTAIILLSCLQQLAPNDFCWLPPPYEYEQEKMPIDILSGSSLLREQLAHGLTERTLAELTALDEANWWREVTPFLLYT